MSRTILETKRRFFGYKEDATFVEGGKEADMSLSDRDKADLLLDKRTCFSRSVFHSVEDWSDVQVFFKRVSHKTVCTM